MKEEIILATINKMVDDGVFTREVAAKYFPKLMESEVAKIKDIIYDCLYRCCDNDIVTKEQRNKCVAWLEKQGEKKPVEWSKQDDIYLDHIENAVKHCYTGEGNPFREPLLDFLKSLRQKLSKVERNGKNWKPNKKQLEALEYAADCTLPHDLCYKRNELKELLEQLKAL